MYLILQSTYTNIELALFDNQKMLAKNSISKAEATSLLIPTIDSALRSAGCTIKDLQFIGINLGPGPFTTLRVLISTVNALAFVTGVHLVGIDGLEALLEESTSPNTVALLNAFAKDVYYATSMGQHGWANIDKFLDELSAGAPKDLTLIGNGATLYKDKIQEKFPDATINEILQFCNLETVAKNCLNKFENKEGISKKLMPLYLKSAI